MNYQELNEKIEQLKEIIRKQLADDKEAEAKNKPSPKWEAWELTQLLSDILELIEGLNERVKKLERKLKET